jgi:hypothetical protein
MDSFLKLLKLLGDDWPGTALSTLKFLGVVVSGFAAIVATAAEKPQKKEKPPPKTRIGGIAATMFSKRWAVRWTVIGLAVALLSQFVESIHSSKESKVAQAKYDAQMTAATNSLVKLQTQLQLSTIELGELKNQGRQIRQQMAYMDHMAGEFDTLTVNITYELVSTNPVALLFTKRVADLVQASTIMDPDLDVRPTMPNGSNQVVTGIINFEPVLGLGSTQDKHRSAGKRFDGYIGNASGYVRITNQSTNTSNIRSEIEKAWYRSFHSGTGIGVSLHHVFALNWFVGASSNTAFMRLVDFIKLPMLGIRIFSSRTTSMDDSMKEADADFVAPPPQRGPIQPKIAYDPSSAGVIFNWSIKYPNDEWQQTIRMGSIHDLDGATLCFYLANIPDFVANDFKPIALNMKFGNTSINVNKFELQSYENVEANRIEPFYTTNTEIEVQVSSGHLTDVTNTYVDANVIDAGCPTTYSVNADVKTNSFGKLYVTNTINVIRLRSFEGIVHETNRVAIWRVVLPPPTYDPIRVENNNSPH